mgnify:CR=1 FL=1
MSISSSCLCTRKDANAKEACPVPKAELSPYAINPYLYVRLLQFIRTNATSWASFDWLTQVIVPSDMKCKKERW